MNARHPHAEVFYDGMCPFCRKAAARWKRGDKDGHLVFYDIRDPDNAARIPEASAADLRRELHVRKTDGGIVRGGRAVVCLWSLRGGAWGLLARVAQLPMIDRVVDAGYRFIARHRGHLA